MDPKKLQILENAKSLFLGQGFKSTTMQAIADAAGVSKGALYLQFSSKKDIFFEIVLQTDDLVLKEVQSIRQNKKVSPRNRLVEIIRVYFEFIHENRLLSELYMHEVGLELTEEMLSQAEVSRLRWQQSIDESVGDFVGPEYATWKADLGFTLTGVVECFHANLLVGRLQITEEALRNYLLLLVETMAPALKQSQLPPMIDPESQAKRHEALQDLDQKRDREIRSILAKMFSSIDRRQQDQSMTDQQIEIYRETIRLLETECVSENPRKAVVQAMIAGLRQVPEFSMFRQQLAELIGVQLI